MRHDVVHPGLPARVRNGASLPVRVDQAGRLARGLGAGAGAGGALRLGSSEPSSALRAPSPEGRRKKHSVGAPRSEEVGIPCSGEVGSRAAVSGVCAHVPASNAPVGIGTRARSRLRSLSLVATARAGAQRLASRAVARKFPAREQSMSPGLRFCGNDEHRAANACGKLARSATRQASHAVGSKVVRPACRVAAAISGSNLRNLSPATRRPRC